MSLKNGNTLTMMDLKPFKDTKKLYVVYWTAPTLNTS